MTRSKIAELNYTTSAAGSAFMAVERRAKFNVMADPLEVICDDCLLNLGVSNIHMNGPEIFVGVAPSCVVVPYGDTYQCSGCGRFYSVHQGYFDFNGQEIHRSRFGPLCLKNAGWKMYVTKPLPEGRALFACPACRKEEEHELNPIPPVPNFSR